MIPYYVVSIVFCVIFVVCLKMSAEAFLSVFNSYLYTQSGRPDWWIVTWMFIVTLIEAADLDRDPV